MKKILIIITCFLLLTGCGKSYTVIDTNRAKNMISDGAILIDVRTPEEYNEGHIENAINIPLDNIKSIDIELDKKIILYCASGVRSTEAAKTLVEMNYEHVYSLDGGLINWG